ncbi:MAG: hypothetical protein ACTIH7_14095, partial [Brevibacterium aurantiacum]
MPRHLLTSTPPNPESRRGGPPGGDENVDGTAATTQRHSTGPIRGRKSLIALFAILLVAWVGVAGV